MLVSGGLTRGGPSKSGAVEGAMGTAAGLTLPEASPVPSDGTLGLRRQRIHTQRHDGRGPSRQSLRVASRRFLLSSSPRPERRLPGQVPDVYRPRTLWSPLRLHGGATDPEMHVRGTATLRRPRIQQAASFSFSGSWRDILKVASMVALGVSFAIWPHWRALFFGPLLPHRKDIRELMARGQATCWSGWKLRESHKESEAPLEQLENCNFLPKLHSLLSCLRPGHCPHPHHYHHHHHHHNHRCRCRDHTWDKLQRLPSASAESLDHSIPQGQIFLLHGYGPATARLPLPLDHSRTGRAPAGESKAEFANCHQHPQPYSVKAAGSVSPFVPLTFSALLGGRGARDP